MTENKLLDNPPDFDDNDVDNFVVDKIPDPVLVYGCDDIVIPLPIFNN